MFRRCVLFAIDTTFMWTRGAKGGGFVCLRRKYSPALNAENRGRLTVAKVGHRQTSAKNACRTPSVL